MTPVTIHNLDQVSAQEVFDFIVRHILDQGEPAIKGNGPDANYCQYRTENGLSCAAGCLIPDEDYEASMEEKRWPQIAEENGVLHHKLLIYSLQDAHDKAARIAFPNNTFLETFRHLATQVANELTLDTTELNR